MEPSRFLADLPPELFGAAIAREVRARDGREVAPRPPAHPAPPRRAPGRAAHRARGASRTSAAHGEPRAVVDYEFDQRPEAGRPFARGDRVVHPSLGGGVVLGCDGAGRDAKVTVRFEAGEKRVLARFLGRGG